MFYLSIFHLHPDYNSEYSVLPHKIPENIIPFPDDQREYFESALYILSSQNYTREYSLLPRFIPANIIPCSILFPRILFFSPDYPRQYSVLPQ